MATSLSAMTARRAATLARLSPSATRAASLIPRRGLSGAAESHGPPSSTGAWIELKDVVTISAVSFAFGVCYAKAIKQISSEGVKAATDTEKD